MVVGSPDPSDKVQPHPDGTIEMILKGMEKKPDDFQMDGSTKLADIGFGKEDFDNFVTYCQNAFNVKPHFDSSSRERLAQSGTVQDLEEKVMCDVKNSKVGSIGDK